MPRSKDTKQLPDLIARAALKIAAQGWEHVTTAKLVTLAPCTMAEAANFLHNPCQTMRALANFITRETLRRFKYDSGVPPRDALFELLMLRFDVLQAYRPGILRLGEACRHDPILAVALAAAQPPQWQAMLQAVQIRRITPLHQAGLGTIYTCALQAWRNDTSADLTKTMATLDKRLGQAERICGLLQFDRNAE